MKIAYIGGCGRLGSAMAAHTAACGCTVYIADLNETAVQAMREGRFCSNEPQVSDLLKECDFFLSTDTAWVAAEAELIRVVVPTPSMPSGRFSSRHVEEACREIAKGLVDSKHEYPVVEIVSTVMPGDTEGPILEALESTGLEAGKDFGLVYSPEFVRQGSIIKDFSDPDVILIGEFDKRSGDAVEQFYFSILKQPTHPAASTIHHMSILNAEIAKLVLNVAVTTKAALANQIAMYCHMVPGADAREVLGAVGDDSRIGRRYFSPGAWVTGPCFPRDLSALIAAMQSLAPVHIVFAVELFNNCSMPRVIANWVAAECPRDANVGILGLAFKPGVDITAESQGVFLADELECRGYAVCTHDPMARDPRSWRQVGTLLDMVYLNSFLVIMTPWEQYFDLAQMDLEGKTVYDMWGLFNDNELECDRYIRFGRGT